MARSSAVSIENNFVGGLKTDFSGLNFPENACTETSNCIFDRTGIVYRRYGIDLELASTTATVDRTNVAISTYLWKNVAGDGNTTLAVVQIGGTLFFYTASSSVALSSNRLATTITLSTFAASGGVSASSNECQYADGNGYLFVTHPGLNPFYVNYNAGAPTGTAITLQVRDFAGLDEGASALTTRPTTLTDTHRYNLANQGWPSKYKAQSTTSITIGTGSKSFTLTASGYPIQAGDRLRVWSLATPGSLGASTNTGNIMIGTVTSYSGTSLVMNITNTNGAGTFTDWQIVEEPDYIDAWPQAVSGSYPSNTDVWWLYKNASDIFTPSTEILNNLPGNTPATKGHFIVNPFDIDRTAISGLTLGASVTTSGARPTTCAFHNGRIFYSGVQFQGQNSKLYFSKIIEGTADFGVCYQQEDPTSESLFDILPSDGGVIQIQGAGTIIKLASVQAALLVFANNGVWAITGSQGIGFTATDYTISKISSIASLSHTSFVDVGGYPMFWSEDGIYAVTLGQGGLSVTSLTAGSTSAFYATIPLSSKRLARGYYNYVTFLVQWVYRSTEATDVTGSYGFNSILNYNTLTQSLYPWSLGDGQPDINGIFVTSAMSGNLVTNQVTSNSGADTVVDGSGNNVVTYGVANSVAVQSTFKYLVSYPSAGSYKFSFAEHYRTSYKDWETTDTNGIDYTSYFISGYKVHGDAQRKFQANYVYVFSVNDQPTGYTLQGIWSFANSQASGAFTSQQRTTSPEIIGLDGENFAMSFRRHKIRGTGLAYQMKISSISGLPFQIAGWSVWETGNARP
jgi:hypothetical protein